MSYQAYMAFTMIKPCLEQCKAKVSVISCKKAGNPYVNAITMKTVNLAAKKVFVAIKLKTA